MASGRDEAAERRARRILKKCDPSEKEESWVLENYLAAASINRKKS